MAKLRVLILGAGAGGLFLARELCQTGCDVTVAGEQPLAGFASTRNQGWLQAGALYAGLGQPAVARECLLASTKLSRLAPSAIGHHQRCFYLFETKADAENFFECAAAAGIIVRSIVDPHAVAATSSFLAGSAFYDFAVEAFDRPFNTRHVLEIVRNQAVALGCRFEKVNIQPGCVQQSGSTWLLPGIVGAYDKVVIAAGAQTATLTSHLGYAIPFDAMWITVLSVAGLKLDSMLLGPHMGQPNLVPFGPGLGDGFTATLAKRDAQGVPNHTLVPAEQKLIEAGIKKYFPAVAHAMGSSAVLVKPYVCTKLSATGTPTARGALIESLDATSTVFAFYPGKFTTSLLAARDCSRAVQGQLAGVIPVSAQPYP